MDGFVRMPMLSVELKYAASSVEFGSKLSKYISDAFQENPGSFKNEISELDALRESACKAPLDVAGCSLMKKYFGQLILLSKRFPMETNDAAAVSFSWFDKYSDLSNSVTVDDVRFEMSCILHNIGAMHSYLGAVDNRATSDGMKVSCTHFQCAAYAFQLLKTGGYNPSQFSTDFDGSILTWHINLMLAQAQECILEKSMIDHRKCNIVAKISIQVSDYYKECLRNLTNPAIDDIVEAARHKSWKRFIETKQKYYLALAHFYCAEQLAPAEEDPRSKDCGENIGQRIAYLQLALDEINQALKIAQKEGQQMKEPLDFVHSVVETKLNLAKKDNDFVYHDKIPGVDTLPELKGAALVKPVPFNPTDVEVCGLDIFQRLIPMSVHNSSSLYSEEKARLLRSICEKVDEKDAELEEFLAAMRLEELCLDTDFQYVPLPERLLECCAAFSAIPDAVPNLLASLNKLSTLYSNVEGILTDFEQQLNEAQKDVQSCQSTYGKDSSLEKLTSELNGLREEYVKYCEANKCATKSNTELHKVLTAHLDNLNLLSSTLTDLKKQLPVPQDCQTDDCHELRRIHAKVEEMKQQRSMLVEDLRASFVKDDITRTLLSVGGDGNVEELFKNELRKHDESLDVINKNLAAQDNVLKALVEANAKCAALRQRTINVLKQRDQKIEAIIRTYEVFVDLNDKSKQGVDFYTKLRSNLSAFGEKMNKFGMQLNEAEEKLEAKKVPAATPVSTGTAAAGPNLKDYLAYYQAKKYGTPLPANQLPYTFNPTVPFRPPDAPTVIPAGVYGQPSDTHVHTVQATVANLPYAVAPQSYYVPVPPQTPYAAYVQPTVGPVGPSTVSQQSPMAFTGGYCATGVRQAPVVAAAVQQVNVMDEPVLVPLPPPMAPTSDFR